jgi:hypothetical protein
MSECYQFINGTPDISDFPTIIAVTLNELLLLFAM